MPKQYIKKGSKWGFVFQTIAAGAVVFNLYQFVINDVFSWLITISALVLMIIGTAMAAEVTWEENDSAQ